MAVSQPERTTSAWVIKITKVSMSRPIIQQYDLGTPERGALFVTATYIKYRFKSLVSTAAPRNDLALLCTLSTYPNKEVAKAATTAFNRHLWYLSELLIGFGFFDDNVTIEEKRLMVVALKENEEPKELIKCITPVLEPAKKGLHDFVTTSTRFFKILGLSEDFL